MTTALEIVKNTSIEYTPAVIKFNDPEAFKAAMAEVVQQYDGYEVTAVTIKQDKAVYTQLNKFWEALETRRKEIKGAVIDPYDQFKAEYDAGTEDFLRVRAGIGAAIQDYNEAQKRLRADHVAYVFAELAKASNLEPADFEVYHANFAKADNFKSSKTGKLDLKPTIIAEINAIFNEHIKKLQERADAVAAIEESAQAVELPSAPYVSLFEAGQTLPEVLKTIRAAADKARQEREEAEARRLADEARRQELQQQAAQEAAGCYTVVDNETGEIMDQPEPTHVTEPGVYQAPKPETDARRVRLVLDMVAPSAEHVKHLKHYLETNGWTYEQQQAHYLD